MSHDVGEDIFLEGQTVCLSGTDFRGYTYGEAGTDVIVPCVSTDANGDYSFAGLAPGDYDVRYVNNSTYDPLTSDGGLVDAV